MKLSCGNRVVGRVVLLFGVLVILQQVAQISNQVQGFLFHQLEPIALAESPDPYSSFNRSAFAPNARTSYNIYPNQEQNLPQYRAANRGTPNHNHQISRSSQHLTRDAQVIQQESNLDLTHHQAACPSECHCNKTTQIADCSNRNLIKVPIGFPQDIKRIRLERNNITELGPFAFQGLKRVQRIDLSNNNLVKIDQQAFSGGLQSLNSLILYSNKLQQLPANLFEELSQLQLLLLNANSLQCIHKDLFQSLANLNLLSLYDNNIETLANGTFEGLKNIKTIHLGKNPLICDCNLAWLAEYLEQNPVETSEARCESPSRNEAKKLSQLGRAKFRCEGKETPKSSQIAAHCAASTALAAATSAGPSSTSGASQNAASGQDCPAGCICDGLTTNCSRSTLSTGQPSSVGSGQDSQTSGIYELPDVPNDVPIYVTRIKINDSRIKRIRETGFFRRLANSQKLDLGNNKIIDIEDNAINGNVKGEKPERVVFILVENEHCGPTESSSPSAPLKPEDACQAAPRVNPPNFDSPCYNGGTCIGGITSMTNANYTCVCPTGFTGPLCEINIDDCVDHQCQNGAQCVDGIGTYKCACRDPTTSGEFCEQLNPPNSIAPLALPIIATGSSSNNNMDFSNSNLQQDHQVSVPAKPHYQAQQQHQPQQQQVLARSTDGFLRSPIEIDRTSVAHREQPQTQERQGCNRVVQRKFFEDANGCRSARPLKMTECRGYCDSSVGADAQPCCVPAKVKNRRVRMVCNDGANYIKTIDIAKKCACSMEQGSSSGNQYNATQDDQLMQITRLDAVD